MLVFSISNSKVCKTVSSVKDTAIYIYIFKKKERKRENENYDFGS